MLLILDETLVSNIEEPHVLNALELIAQNRRYGNHLIFAEISILAYLAECMRLSETARRVFLNLHSKIPQKYSLLSKISLKVKVVAGSDVLMASDNEGAHEITVAAKFFDNPDLSNACVILSENISDSFFYEYLAKYHLRKSGLDHVCLRSEPRGGGGNTTSAEFKNIQERRSRFCLCICDSDKKHPTDNIGDTAKAVRAVDDKDQPLCDFLFLEFRQKENLLPSLLIEEAIKTDPNRLAGLSVLRKLETLGNGDARNFYDFRKGLRRKQLQLNGHQSPTSTYWAKVLSDIKISISPVCSICGKTCELTDPCLNILTPGLGNKIFDAVVDVIKDKAETDVFSKIEPMVSKEWNRVGAVVVSWCCSGSPLYSV